MTNTVQSGNSASIPTPTSLTKPSPGVVVPAYNVESRTSRIAKSLPLTQLTVRELDQESRLKVLAAAINTSQSSGIMRRWASELQGIESATHGNYLNQLHAKLEESNSSIAAAFVRRVARDGIVVSPDSGYFSSLSHFDPKEKVDPKSSGAGAKPSSRVFVDTFVSAEYDPNYRTLEKGRDSTYLALKYADGTRLDVDYRTIADNQDQAWSQSLAFAATGPGGRSFPLRMSRETTPRLWQAKHTLALQRLAQENRDFEFFTNLATTGILANLPAGPPIGLVPHDAAVASIPSRSRSVTGQRAIAQTGTTRPAGGAPSLTERFAGVPVSAPANPGYEAGVGEVIGTVVPEHIPTVPYGTTQFGTAIESQLTQIVRARFPKSQFRFNIGAGKTGVDVTWIGGEYPGFHIADFKADTIAGYAKFVSQVRRIWSGGPMVIGSDSFQAAALMYQSDGSLFVGDIATTRPLSSPTKPPLLK